VRILVYGGTGSQIQPLLQQLTERHHDTVVVTRNASAQPGRPGVSFVQADLDDPASLYAASRGMDAVAFLMPAFLSKPERRLVYANSAMRAAADAGVNNVVWNASGSLPETREESGSGHAVWQLWETLKDSGVPLTVVAPTKYMENLLGPWTAPELCSSNHLRYPIPSDRRVGWIAAADVCAFMLECLERPSLAGRVFRVSGPAALTGYELARAFSEALDRPIVYEPLPLPQMERAVERQYGPGTGSGVYQEYGRLQNPNAAALYHEMDAVLAQLPVAMTDIRKFVREHRAAFESQPAP
jgi:uncharacterized protein YbjT (DUF2867 family)